MVKLFSLNWLCMIEKKMKNSSIEARLQQGSVSRLNLAMTLKLCLPTLHRWIASRQVAAVNLYLNLENHRTSRSIADTKNDAHVYSWEFNTRIKSHDCSRLKGLLSGFSDSFGHGIETVWCYSNAMDLQFWGQWPLQHCSFRSNQHQFGDDHTYRFQFHILVLQIVKLFSINFLLINVGDRIWRLDV